MGSGKRRKNKIKTYRLKYCGGCKPDYDRVAAAEEIIRLCNGRIRLVTQPEDDLAGMVVLTGCKTACVEPEAQEDLPVYRLTGEQGIEALCRLLCP